MSRVQGLDRKRLSCARLCFTALLLRNTGVSHGALRVAVQRWSDHCLQRRARGVESFRTRVAWRPSALVNAAPVCRVFSSHGEGCEAGSAPSAQPERDGLLERCQQGRLLSTPQKRRLSQLCDLLLERNRHVNLTAIRTEPEVYEKHFVDSLRFVDIIETLCAGVSGERPRLAASNHFRLLDLGSGGGFPGLVLGIARPSWELVLLDATRKKCDWLREAVEALQLSNVSVIWDRAELAAHKPALREAFDCVVARAVARLPALSELALPFVRIGGYFLAAKEYRREASTVGDVHWPELASAMRSIEANGGRYMRTVATDTDGAPTACSTDMDDHRRVIVIVHKQHPTPSMYPRAPGVPERKPL